MLSPPLLSPRKTSLDIAVQEEPQAPMVSPPTTARRPQFAGPLPSASQITNHVLLPSTIFGSAMEANLDSNFEKKTQTRAALFGICARTLVSCLRNVNAREAVKGAWERAIHSNFHSDNSLLCSRTINKFSGNGSRNEAPRCFFQLLISRKKRKIEKCLAAAQACTDCMRDPAVERPRKLKIMSNTHTPSPRAFFVTQMRKSQKMVSKGFQSR